MIYQMVVSSFELNPKYEEELRASNRFPGQYINEAPMPCREIEKNVLRVALTEDQFKAVKRAVLEVFE